MRRGAVMALATMTLFIGGGAAAADPAKGETLYVDYGCFACHGYNGTGRTPLTAATSGILSSEALFIRYLRLRADQNPVNPQNSMPNYSAATLPDEAAGDIYAYLLTLEDDAPPIEEIPAFMEMLDDARRGPDRETDDH